MGNDVKMAWVNHGGGYILAASRTIAPETPADNVAALCADTGLSHEMILNRAADLRA